MLHQSGRELRSNDLIKESRLTIRGGDDQDLVSSEEIWTSPFI